MPYSDRIRAVLDQSGVGRRAACGKGGLAGGKQQRKKGSVCERISKRLAGCWLRQED
ncbi:hypothetical protein VU08_08510 [Desulfobulbus sp. F5]|nr:hypothetical protein [Desulfobulbus sp. F5]